MLFSSSTALFDNFPFSSSPKMTSLCLFQSVYTALSVPREVLKENGTISGSI